MNEMTLLLCVKGKNIFKQNENILEKDLFIKSLYADSRLIKLAFSFAYSRAYKVDIRFKNIFRQDRSVYKRSEMNYVRRKKDFI